jgi:hypothetical protein
MNLATTVVPAGRSFSGAEVVAIRNRRHMSQAQFENLLAAGASRLCHRSAFRLRVSGIREITPNPRPSEPSGTSEQKRLLTTIP